MKEMKYVVVDSKEAGEQMFIFPKSVNHDRVAEVLTHHIKHGDDLNWERIYRKPIAAGFTDGTIFYGESETLKLKSRGDKDAALVR